MSPNVSKKHPRDEAHEERIIDVRRRLEQVRQDGTPLFAPSEFVNGRHTVPILIGPAHLITQLSPFLQEEERFAYKNWDHFLAAPDIKPQASESSLAKTSTANKPQASKSSPAMANPADKPQASDSSSAMNGTNPNTAAVRANGAGTMSQPHSETHAMSGYTWTREEDAPGYSWRSKKGQEEMAKAWDQVETPNETVSTKYADPALLFPVGTPWNKII